MSDFTCTRCHKITESMPQPPFPGAAGARVQEQVCAPCWKEWLGAQVNIINEHRLTMINAEHRARLNREMKEFLNLSD